MKEEILSFYGREFKIFKLENPVFHKHWHDVEDKGLVFLKYQSAGYRYDGCDGFFYFVKKEDEEIARDYFKC